MQQLHVPAAKWFYLIGSFAIQTTMMAEESMVEYVNEEVVEEQYVYNDIISLES